jgi:excisionase family DNA binding protein
MASEKMLTTSEVAAKLNVSLRRVRQLIEEGRLPSQQFGRDHLIKEADLKLVEDRKPGRPPKAAGKKTGKTTPTPSPPGVTTAKEALLKSEAKKKNGKKKGGKR